MCTVNVNGFRQKFKQKVILERLKERSFDVVFLQETHITNLREGKMAARHWNGKHFWSFGSNYSRGVGMLIAKDLDYSLVNKQHDTDGRICCIDIDMGANQYRLLNIYAPNDPGERKMFIENLEQYFVVGRECLLGGDFNFVEDLRIDKIGGNSRSGDIGSKQMRSLRDDFFLIDAFRSKWPNKKRYSWRQGAIHERLDRWYIPDHMIQWVDTVKYVPCSVSDPIMWN